MKLYVGSARKGLVTIFGKNSIGQWRRALALVIAVLFLFYPVAPASFADPASAKAATYSAAAAPSPQGGCNLNSPRGNIQHVVYIQFDNVHFTRDNPNVPSDLEQMPHLLSFIENNGTLLSNHHTPLISHTADDIITSLTGVYGDRHGQPISNSFNYFDPKADDGLGSIFTSSFTYWTDIVDPVADPTFNLLTPAGMNAPAPWVPFTRAGCNVGAVSIANMELENVSSDLETVFASDKAELRAALAEAKNNAAQAEADFEGIAIHCAAGNAVCSSQNHGEPDVLSQEPNGYSGFSALYGHTFVAPVISPNAPFVDLNGQPLTGFPGFGGISAYQTLAYVAAMQEHGVPVTYSYISDAHAGHSSPFLAFGPGQAGYVQQLAAYDDAFNKFFTRLANDGINPSNTLFVVTADEGDHFVGGPPTNPGCDGVNVPCTYTAGTVGPNTIGELLSNIQSLLGKADPSLNFSNTPFDIHFDMAPAFYISGQPAPGAAIARQFERDAGKLTGVNPRTGNTDTLTRYLADPVELKLLHMITGDPLRTPTFVMFGNPDYFFQTFGVDVSVNPSFAWNHGGVAPEINTTWLGLVGPGVTQTGVDSTTWSDHTDIRPTMLVLLGLQDDYQHEGRALTEELTGWAQPSAVKRSANFVALAQTLKQINAPVGPLGLASLQASTAGLESSDPGDATYTNIESQLASFTSQRDALAGQILALLEAAEFNNQPIPDQQAADLIQQAQGLLSNVQAFANNL